jgi:hypothetical protein
MIHATFKGSAAIGTEHFALLVGFGTARPAALPRLAIQNVDHVAIATGYFIAAGKKLGRSGT